MIDAKSGVAGLVAETNGSLVRSLEYRGILGAYTYQIGDREKTAVVDAFARRPPESQTIELVREDTFEANKASRIASHTVNLLERSFQQKGYFRRRRQQPAQPFTHLLKLAPTLRR